MRSARAAAGASAMAGTSARARAKRLPSPVSRSRGRSDYLRLASRGHAHPKLARCDFLDAGVHGPGALLELELPPFDFQLFGKLLFLLELDVQLARLMLCRDERECAHDDDGEQQEIRSDHQTVAASGLCCRFAFRARGTASLEGHDGSD